MLNSHTTSPSQEMMARLLLQAFVQPGRPESDAAIDGYRSRIRELAAAHRRDHPVPHPLPNDDQAVAPLETGDDDPMRAFLHFLNTGERPQN